MNRIRTSLFAAVILLVLWSQVAWGITINPTYVDGAGYSWTTERRGVIQQAINDWQTALPDSHTVNVTLDFTNVGTSYLGQWYGQYSLYEGTDVYPWTDGVTHTISFNTYYFTGSTTTWWDPTPTTSSDLTSNKCDALSVARHEIGHMLGFTDDFYVDNFYTPQEVDKWGVHISGTTFDTGGLNVTMESAYDWGHVRNSGTTAGDLMVTQIPPGVRRWISATDLNMLKVAYNYTIVPPTTYTLTATAGKIKMHVGDTSSITATIRNTGTGLADTLDFTGLRTNASGGTVNGSSTSGGPLAIGGGSASNTGLTFTSASPGEFTIMPTATATNHTLGWPATLSSTATSVKITVYSGQGEWDTTSSGSWTDANNWTALGGVPGIDGVLSANDTARFKQGFQSLATVSLNGATPRLSILSLESQNSNTFTVARGTGGSLTLQAPSGRAQIWGMSGSNIISAPVVLGSDTQIGCAAGAALSMSGGISGNHTLTIASTMNVSSIRVNTLQIGSSFWINPSSAVPEPSTTLMLVLGIVGAVSYFRQRWKAQPFLR